MLHRRLAVGAIVAVAAGLSACAGQGGARAAASGANGGSNVVAAASIPSGDWRQFDDNAARSGVGPTDTGITAGNLRDLKARVMELPGTVDSAPVELHGVRVGGRVRDVVIVTTSYGISLAIDPATGRRLWKYEPRGTAGLEGGPQLVTATPIVDPDRRFVYTASPNGFIHKLRISSGRQVWGRKITFDAQREKIEGALNIERGSVIAATGGYNGDTPVYQGHIVTISRRTGHITHVWNSLCSNRRHLIDPPSSCPVSDSALLARAGSVIEPGSGRILIATGNGPFNGSTNWGDSVLELSRSVHLVHNWTPTDQASLNSGDQDLGSTEPAILPAVDGLHLAVQGGKDGVLRLLNLRRLDGTTHGAGPRTGGQLQSISAPGSTDVFTQPAVWRHGGHIYVFVTTFGGTTAYELSRGHRLLVAWSSSRAGTSPLVAGGLLYVFDPNNGSLLVRNPVNGHLLSSLAAAPGHWNSPIVVGGRIVLPVGDDNDHLTHGRLFIYHLPGR